MLNSYLGWQLEGRQVKRGAKKCSVENGLAQFHDSQLIPDNRRRSALYIGGGTHQPWNPGPTSNSLTDSTRCRCRR